MSAGIDAIVARLGAFPDELRTMVAGRDVHELQRAAAGGGWGPVEIFCHLRDLDGLFIERVERIVSEDQPYIAAVDETLWPIERDYASQDPLRALDEFAANRGRYVALLAGLTADQLQRHGHHEELGDQTVLWHALHTAEHDTAHRHQLAEALGEP